MKRINYRLKFYLNASHYVTFGSRVSDIHPHTWEIVTDVSIREQAVIQFTDLEKEIARYFKSLDGCILNDRPEFTGINPTLENIGDFFASRILMLLEDRMWEMYKFEIYENPTRAFLFEKSQLDEKLADIGVFKARLLELEEKEPVLTEAELEAKKIAEEKARKIEEDIDNDIGKVDETIPVDQEHQKYINYFRLTAIVLIVATASLAYFGIPEFREFILQYF